MLAAGTPCDDIFDATSSGGTAASYVSASCRARGECDGVSSACVAPSRAKPDGSPCDDSNRSGIIVSFFLSLSLSLFLHCASAVSETVRYFFNTISVALSTKFVSMAFVVLDRFECFVCLYI